jgi:hypothetical protein
MSPRLSRAALLALVLLLAPLAALRAQGTPLASGAVRADAPNVFLDCGYRCDEEFLRTEITYVNWVRDRAVADVHLLVTTQATGGSGTEFTLAFLGLRRFAGLGDTLRYVAQTTNTPDDTRRGLARTMALGLARYVARTEGAARLTIGVERARGGDARPATASPAHDPWNYWTFRLSGNTNFNGERFYEYRYYSGTVSANRVTAAWKTSFNLNTNQSSNRFVLEDVEGGDRTAVTSFRRSVNLSNLTVKSLTSHWSAGLRTSAGSSTYLNQQFAARILPAVEYDVYPYDQSTRRQFRFEYGIGAQLFDYKDTTIYEKLRETKPVHSGQATLDLRQPWGSVNVSLDGQQYLDDPLYYRWSFFTNASVRVFKGLNVNFYGGYDRIRDQIYLSAGGVSRDEVLLRQRQLATGYSYFGGIGLSYTFGSIYNNVVNPRFGGSGGMIIIE